MNARMQRALAVASAIAVPALLVPPVRRGLEADMARHMLIEFPLLIAAGYGLAIALPARLRVLLAHVDRLGLVSLSLTSATLGLWMIPAALDATLAGPGYAAAKHASLLIAGVLLQGVTERSPPAIQAFFVGGIAWMTATVGLLYQEAPQPLCLYYLADMQQRAGWGLVVLAVLGGGYWCVRAGRIMHSNGRNTLTARL